MNQNIAFQLTESGYVPDLLIRRGIKKLLQQRLNQINAFDITKMAEQQADFIAHMNQSEIAVLPHKANEQHYEIPWAFYLCVLGPHAKYSCCYWPEGVNTLAKAERAGLQQTCERAQIEDGMKNIRAWLRLGFVNDYG